MTDQEKELTAEEKQLKALAAAEARRQAKFFAAVRMRGVLNHMLDEPVTRFEKANPGWRARWEYAGKTQAGEQTFIMAREGLGFHVVQRSELGELLPSEAKEGPVVVGDLILMAAEAYIVDAIEMADAKAAWDDWKLPQTAYKQHIEDLTVRSKAGNLVKTEATGEIKRHEELLTAGAGAGQDHEVSNDKGGE